MKRHFASCAILNLIATLFVFHSSTHAAITVTTFDNPIDPGLHNQGWWSSSDSNTNTANISTSTGASTQFGMLRGYFTFYLPQLPLQVARATLILDDRGGSLSTTDEWETVGFFDVTTDPVVLNRNLGPSGTIYNDLGSGKNYGQFVIPGKGPLEDSLTFELNATAVADINAKGAGYFSIGAALLSNDGNDSVFVGHTKPSLTLQFVPEPSSLAMTLLGGALSVGHLRQRRRLNPVKS